MISMIQTGALLNTNLTPQNAASADLVGLSTDTKPTGMSVGNGWTYIEMDTGKVFFYNAADEEWLEFAGSGGGSGGNSGIYTVVISETNDMGADRSVSIVQGDFATAQQKITALEPILFIAYLSDINDGVTTFSLCAIEGYSSSYIDLSTTFASTYSWTESGIDFGE